MKTKILSLIVALLLLGMMGYVTANSGSNKITTKSGQTAYGFCVSDENWGEVKNYGLYTFSTTSPTTLSKRWATDLAVDAAAYYDGYYYVQTSTLKPSGTGYASMKFGKFNATTGAYIEIADWYEALPQFPDLTIDYSTTPPRLLGFQYSSPTMSRLVSINMATGARTVIGNITAKFTAMACDKAGNIYVISKDGKLQKITINGTNVTATDVVDGVSTGVFPTGLQSMEFDHANETETLYWAARDADKSEFGTINLTTALFTSIGEMGNNSSIVGLYIPFAFPGYSAPEEVVDLTIMPDPAGLKQALISWTNPSLNRAGDLLDAITAVKIYRNNELIETVQTHAVGSQDSYSDNVTTSGIYTYKVIAENGGGIGREAAAVSTFIGEDVPKPPTNITTELNGSEVIISWEAPTVGANNGWIDVDAMKYDIVRNPNNVVMATDLEVLTYTDNTISELNSYTYTIKAKTRAGSSAGGTSSPILIGNPLSIPYLCTFSAEQFALWTVVNDNTDSQTWELNDNTVTYSYNEDEDANDWLISPPVSLSVGIYKLSYDYRSGYIGITEKMKVKLGRGGTPEAQVDLLMDYDNIENATFVTGTVIVNISKADIYNFSFHVYSEADMGDLSIANVRLESMLENDMAVIEISGNALPRNNVINTYEVTVKNEGFLNKSNFSIQLIDENNEVLTTQLISETVNANETETLHINWKPILEGKMEVRAKLVMPEDQNDLNDISSSITVVVQPEGREQVVIGTGMLESTNAPINFNFKNSISQTIYLNSEIGLNGGTIKEIIYPYNNINTIGSGAVEFSKPIRLYLANTDLSVLADGWIPENQFTLAFDGEVTVLPGTGHIIIPLSTPFEYTGSNICVMNKRENDTEKISNIKFYTTTPKPSVVRGRCFPNDNPIFDWSQLGLTLYDFPKIIMQFEAEINPTEYTVTITPSENGILEVKNGDDIIASGDTFEVGAILTIKTIPNEGYHAVNTTINGEVLTSETFVLTKSITVASTFEINKYPVTWTNPDNGTIVVKNGSTNVTTGTEVEHNTTLTISAAAETGYTLTELTVNNTPFTSGQTHTVEGITEIRATTTINQYPVTWSNPTGVTVTVNDGTSNIVSGAKIEYSTMITITATAQTGYTLSSLTVNGMDFESDGTLTVTSAIEIVATATVNTYTVTWTDPEGAIITVRNAETTVTSGTSVDYNTQLHISATAETGYTLATLTVNGSSFTSGQIHTVTGDVNIIATAAINSYTITVTQSNNGTISPETLNVNHCSDQRFTITPNAGYEIEEVLVDNESVGIKVEHTFTNVTSTHTLTAIFKLIPTTHTITASAGENGTITPSGIVTVEESESQTFIITPNTDYIVADVLVDNQSIGTIQEYTFTNIVANHTISVSFKKPDAVKDINTLSLHIYPNPFKDVMNIKGDYTLIEIYNATGKLMIAAHGESTIDVNSLPGGIYIIKARNNNEVGTYKMVKE